MPRPRNLDDLSEAALTGDPVITVYTSHSLRDPRVTKALGSLLEELERSAEFDLQHRPHLGVDAVSRLSEAEKMEKLQAAQSLWDSRSREYASAQGDQGVIDAMSEWGLRVLNQWAEGEGLPQLQVTRSEASDA